MFLLPPQIKPHRSQFRFLVWTPNRAQTLLVRSFYRESQQVDELWVTEGFLWFLQTDTRADRCSAVTNKTKTAGQKTRGAIAKVWEEIMFRGSSSPCASSSITLVYRPLLRKSCSPSCWLPAAALRGPEVPEETDWRGDRTLNPGSLVDADSWKLWS